MITQEQQSDTVLLKQVLSVPFSYPVYFTRDVFAADNPILRQVLELSEETGARAMCFFDEGFAAAHAHTRAAAMEYLAQCGDAVQPAGEPIMIPGGEEAKDGWQHVNRMIEIIMSHKLDRHSYIIAAGGGAFLDAVGFAAGIIHRGIRLIRIPTTALSQDDSGVGVKNGINLGSVKNMLGTFAPPFAVINDFSFLTTLNKGLILDGIAEAFKVAIIKDLDFFTFLEDQAENINTLEMPIIEETIRRCAEIHLEHIADSDDPFEFGVSRPLDFGHWSAHMLESMSNFEIRHGQAVAAGIALDTCYAEARGLISITERDRILQAMAAAGLELFYDLLLQTDKHDGFKILKGVEQFREHLGGKLSLTLPQGLGSRIEITELNQSLIIQCLYFMAKWNPS